MFFLIVSLLFSRSDFSARNLAQPVLPVKKIKTAFAAFAVKNKTAG